MKILKNFKAYNSVIPYDKECYLTKKKKKKVKNKSDYYNSMNQANICLYESIGFRKNFQVWR